MRIGIVCYPTFGGSGVVATELGLALAEEGHVVHFITYDRPVRLGTGPANVFYHEVRVSDYPLFDYQPYELVLTSKLVDVVKHERLDLLHVHYAIPHASAAWMAQQILRAQDVRIPFITTLHGTDITLVGRDPSFEPGDHLRHGAQQCGDRRFGKPAQRYLPPFPAQARDPGDPQLHPAGPATPAHPTPCCARGSRRTGRSCWCSEQLPPGEACGRCARRLRRRVRRCLLACCSSAMGPNAGGWNRNAAPKALAMTCCSWAR